jgi:hypothetical protein
MRAGAESRQVEEGRSTVVWRGHHQGHHHRRLTLPFTIREPGQRGCKYFYHPFILSFFKFIFSTITPESLSVAMLVCVCVCVCLSCFGKVKMV